MNVITDDSDGYIICVPFQVKSPGACDMTNSKHSFKGMFKDKRAY